MKSNKIRPTVDELFELLKRTSLPTVLVEGKDDIIFYRRVEQDLADYGVDFLPAGNKHSVLELRKKIAEHKIEAPIAFIVDKDLWVHHGVPDDHDDVITTKGYSVENDIFTDGELLNLLSPSEFVSFKAELHKFITWYSLSIMRHDELGNHAFREHPGKVLDDAGFFDNEVKLQEHEEYPEQLNKTILNNYEIFLRGKTLFALLLRQLSKANRAVKFSGKQLMEIGAARKGENYCKIRELVEEKIAEQKPRS